MLPKNNPPALRPPENPSADFAKPPLFSIIIPAFNVAPYLAACLDSVLAQKIPTPPEAIKAQSDRPLFELIIIDDGSTDETGKIADQYKKHPQPTIIPHISEKVNPSSPISPKITIIRQKNSGLSAARNAGVEKASGEYLIFLDGDDFLEPNALETIKNALEPNLDLLRFQAQTVSSAAKVEKAEKTPTPNNPEPPATTPYPEPPFSTTAGTKAFPALANMHYTENAWLYAYRRAFFLENDFRYAPGRISEDFGLTPLVIARARTVKAISDICYNYRQRPGSIMSSLKIFNHNRDNTPNPPRDHNRNEPPNPNQARRARDMQSQLEPLLPELAKIPGSAPIAHYLVVSFLTAAADLSLADFLKFYRAARRKGWLRLIRPSRLKSLPRSLTLRLLPKLFYKLYG